MDTAGTIFLNRQGECAAHTYMAPLEGEMVCTHIIETPHRLVIVDAQLLMPYAQEVHRYAVGLGKPVERVIISHAHPDHWMGLEAFKDYPIYALPETRDELASAGEYLLDYRRSINGDKIASTLVLPTHEISEGDTDIDGVTFHIKRVVDAEAPLMLTIELPELNTLVAQDLVYNQVYVVVGEKNAAGDYLFNGWINHLEALQRQSPALILAGHGEPTTPAIFAELIEYIRLAQKLFESGIEENALKQELRTAYPHYRVPEMLDLMTLFLYHRTW